MTDGTLPMGKTRLLALDGVRGIAVLLVMSFHLAGITGFNTRIENAVHAIVMQRWVRVELFGLINFRKN